MKILIITTNVGRSAPGIVFERLIDGLSKDHEVDLMTSDLDPSFELSNVNKIFEVKKKSWHHRVPKLLIPLFGTDPFDWFWSIKAIGHLKKDSYREYDLVFSLISFHHYWPLIAGRLYSDKIKAKFGVYSVDAIPAPLGWSANDSYFKAVNRMMGNYLSKVDLLFSANEQMLKYQLGTFKPKAGLITNVVYNPSDGIFKRYTLPNSDENIFLYTGGIYQVRKAEYMLKAFERLLRIFPNSILVFVGSQLSQQTLSVVGNDTQSKIKILPHTRDLSSYYCQATALLDIDADLEDDVFLSSKIINYLMINRTIISETGKNSPSRRLFAGIDSIIQCEHSVDEIYEAMRKAILIKCTITFEDRNNVAKLFSIKNIIEELEISFAKANLPN